MLQTQVFTDEKVEVFQVKRYNDKDDEHSRRWATRIGAENMRCDVIESTRTLIDSKHLEPEGWTAIGFMPEDVK